ncbi:MAG: response regulator [Myxococcales bacterium]|nr:response regulator [Myxococcales bacterium]
MPALVLVADADPFNLRLLAELCESLGYGAVTAADGEAVLESVGRQLPDLVVMDAALPGTDGLQVLQILRGDRRFADVPVVLATGDEDEERRRAGLEMGADDYVRRPYRTFEVQQRIRNTLRMRSRGAVPSDRPPHQTADPETGAGTPAQLHMSLDYEFTRAVRYGHPLSCVVVRCRNYGDLQGNLEGAAGSAVLVPLADALQRCIRGVDHLFRSGNDEFTVLLPETDTDGCQIVVERLHAKTLEPQLFDAALSPRPHIKVSAASYPKDAAPDGEALWRHAVAGL